MPRIPGDPGFFGKLKFAVGFRLPPANREWVRHELTDAGWRARTVFRHLVVMVPVCCVLAALPGPARTDRRRLDDQLLWDRVIAMSSRSFIDPPEGTRDDSPDPFRGALFCTSDHGGRVCGHSARDDRPGSVRLAPACRSADTAAIPENGHRTMAGQNRKNNKL